ncbi:MAG: hypothetical protein ACTSRF_11070 [Candidatus Freyarchaeota archaeon]
MEVKLFYLGIVTFLIAFIGANGLLFLPSSGQIDLIIFMLSFVELLGILGAVILLLGYWVVPFVIYFAFPQSLIPIDLLRQLFLPPLLVRLTPAAVEITGLLIIITNVRTSLQGASVEN